MMVFNGHLPLDARTNPILHILGKYAKCTTTQLKNLKMHRRIEKKMPQIALNCNIHTHRSCQNAAIKKLFSLKSSKQHEQHLLAWINHYKGFVNGPTLRIASTLHCFQR